MEDLASEAGDQEEDRSPEGQRGDLAAHDPSGQERVSPQELLELDSQLSRSGAGGRTAGAEPGLLEPGSRPLAGCSSLPMPPGTSACCRRGSAADPEIRGISAVIVWRSGYGQVGQSP